MSVRFLALSAPLSALWLALLASPAAFATPSVPAEPTPLAEPAGLGGTGPLPTLDLNTTSGSPGGPAELTSPELSYTIDTDPLSTDIELNLAWDFGENPQNEPIEPHVSLDYFVVLKREGPGSWHGIARKPASARTHGVFIANSNERYHFRVIAVYRIEDEEFERPSDIERYEHGLSASLYYRWRDNKPYTVCGFQAFTPDPAPETPPEDPCAASQLYRKKTHSHSGNRRYNYVMQNGPPFGTRFTENSGYEWEQHYEGCDSVYSGNRSYDYDYYSWGPSASYWEKYYDDINAVMGADGAWRPATGTSYRAWWDGRRVDYDPATTYPSGVPEVTIPGSAVTVTTSRSTYTEKTVTSIWRQPPAASYTTSGSSTKKETLSDPIVFDPAKSSDDMEMNDWNEDAWEEDPLFPNGLGGLCSYRHRGTPPEFSDKCSPILSLSEAEYYFSFPRETADATVRWALVYTPDHDANDEPVAEPTIDYKEWSASPGSRRSPTYTLTGNQLGTYCVQPFTARLRVSDWRGLVSTAEQETSLFADHNEIAGVLPEPSGATILVNANATTLSDARLYIELGGGPVTSDWEITLAWNSGQLKLYRSETGETSGVILTSPHTAKLSEIGHLRAAAYYSPSNQQRHYTGKVSMQVKDEEGRSVCDDEAYIHVARHDLPDDPRPPASFDERITFSDAVGNRYRKISLTGRPLSDEKPQAEAETDELREETYIDALNLHLVHSVSDIHIPIPGSELTLGARRNHEPEIWNLGSGLRPHERLDLPFGPGWSSNLVSFIEFTDPYGAASANGENPTEALVHDDTGAVHRFVMYTKAGQIRWVPFVTAKNQGRAFLNSLEFVGTEWVFKQKYGKALYFKSGQAGGRTRGDIFPYADLPGNRVRGGGGHTVYSYGRLDRVVDRLGYKLLYTYPGPNTLIPKKIHAVLPDGSVLPGQQLFICQADAPEHNRNKRITRVWDPMGNTIDYTYDTGLSSVIPRSGQAQPLPRLLTTEVRSALSTLVSRQTYAYDFAIEPPTIPEPQPEKSEPNLHLNLVSIADGLGHTWRFDYRFDHTKSIYVESSDGPNGYFPQNGLPRWVSLVQLPDRRSRVQFDNLTNISVRYTPGLPDVLEGERKTSVTDPTGAATTYHFEGNQIVTLTAFRDLYHPGAPPTTKFYNPRLIYYTKMSVRHADIGTETFTYNPSAGLALSSTVDLCGKHTDFFYETALTAPQWLTDIYPAGSTLFLFWDDVTRQVNAINGTRTFTYSPHFRMMETIADEAGRETRYTIDALGRRTAERTYATVGGTTPAAETVLDHDPVFKGVVTRRTLKRLASDPVWAADLVTDYTLDSRGRVHEQITYPGVNADGGAVSALTTTFTYDLNNNRVSLTDPRGKITVFAYDGFNRLLRTTHHNDDYVLRDYDLAGSLLFEKTHGASGIVRHESYDYDAFRRRTESKVAKDAAAGSPLLGTQFKYSPVGSLLETTDPRGGVTRHTYDALQRLTATTDAEGNRTRYDYDLVLNPGGSVFASSGFKPTRVIDTRGYSTRFAYDGLYRLTTQSAEYERGKYAATRHGYDAVGNLLTRTDPLGVVTHTTYDTLNRPLVVTAAYGTVEAIATSTAYTGTGLPWRVTDGRGYSTERHYDEAGRAIKVIAPNVTAGQAITRTFYDASGSISRTIEPRGHATDFTYDDRNRLLQTQLPSVLDALDLLGGSARPTTTVNGYRADGLQTSVTDPKGHTTAYHYDGLGRLIRTVHPTGFGETLVAYDDNGNILTVTDAEGKVTTNTYDKLNRLTATTDAETIQVAYAYDAAGNRLTVRDGRGQITRFAYDGLSRLTRETDPAGVAKVFVYDAVNKTRQIDGLGRATAYIYDKHHRLKDSLPLGTPAENRAFTYDNNGNLLSATHPNQDGATDTAYTYDARNQRFTETSSGITHTYGYDLAGLRTSLSTDDATDLLVRYQFDAAGRLEKVIQGPLVGDPTTLYEYDLNGNAHRLTLPSGEKTVTVHDALNRVTERRVYAPGSGTPATTFVNTLDKAGNVTAISETYHDARLPNRTIANVYDDIYRLEQETTVTAAHGSAPAKTVVTTYGYDAAHNRRSRTLATTVSGTTTTQTDAYSYNALNQLTSWDKQGGAGPNGGTTYLYDANGNRVERKWMSVGYPPVPVATAYHYDRDNRLVRVIENAEKQSVAITPSGHPARAITAYYFVGGSTYGYRYDHRIRRVQRAENGAGPVRVTYAGGVSVAEYPVASTTPGVRYVRGMDIGGGVGGNLYSLRSGVALYSQYNHRGDVVARTDATGAATYAAAYEAFGRTPEIAGTNPDRFAANSKEKDPTGLLNEGFRYRDLETGTFLTRDPLGFVDGPNLYAYVMQNPWSYFDPEGLSKVKLLRQLGRLDEILKYAPDGRAIVNGLPVKMPKGLKPGDTFHFSGDLAQKYKSGVKFDEKGFPDFSSYSKKDVKIDMKGTYEGGDFAAADKAAGFNSKNPRPDGYTWHHNQDGETMQLVPSEVNGNVPHTGGAAMARAAEKTLGESAKDIAVGAAFVLAPTTTQAVQDGDYMKAATEGVVKDVLDPGVADAYDASLGRVERWSTTAAENAQKGELKSDNPISKRINERQQLLNELP